MRARRQSAGAKQALRLHQALDPLLSERLGMQSQIVELAERRELTGQPPDSAAT